MSAGFAIGLGEGVQLLGVRQTWPRAESKLRLDCAFLETTCNMAAVEITVWSEAGEQPAFEQLQVREWSQRQEVFADHFPEIPILDYGDPPDVQAVAASSHE